MPSLMHEFLVDMFRDCPALAPEILRRAAGPGSGAGNPGASSTARTTSAEFSEATITQVEFGKSDIAEYRADAVIRLDDDNGDALEVIVVEVQLGRDGAKQWTWPLYAVGARARFTCPTSLLVVTMDDGVAHSCARPISLTERSIRYADFILASLGQAARVALEKHMSVQHYEFQSDFAKKYVKEGRDEGQRALGRALLRLLAQRFDEIPEPVRARIESAEFEDLERWLARVIPARTLDEVFQADAPGDE